MQRRKDYDHSRLLQKQYNRAAKTAKIAELTISQDMLAPLNFRMYRGKGSKIMCWRSLCWKLGCSDFSSGRDLQEGASLLSDQIFGRKTWHEQILNQRCFCHRKYTKKVPQKCALRGSWAILWHVTEEQNLSYLRYSFLESQFRCHVPAWAYLRLVPLILPAG